MRKKIGELLIESGATTIDEVNAALIRQQTGAKGRLGELLIASGKVNPAAVARALAIQAGLPFVRLSDVSREAAALILLDDQVEHRMVAFRLDGETVHLAIDDPTDLTFVEELRFDLMRDVKAFVASSDDIDRALKKLRDEPAKVIDPLPFEIESNDEPKVIVHDDLLAETGPVIDDVSGESGEKDDLEIDVDTELDDSDLVETPSVDFSEEDLKILDSLERMAQGKEPTLDSEKVRPAQMVASLIRLLMKKGIIHELEFLEELARK